MNRVFDSSGPEGKVRGTPQQIIEKYQQLTSDAQLSGDRVAAENFQQHAEHYMRLLAEAQREVDARREQQEREAEARREQQERDNREKQAQRDKERAEQAEKGEQTADDAAPVADLGEGEQPDLVETPEASEKPKPRPRRRKPAPKAETAEQQVEPAAE